ncbi:Di-trans-poly-cis-decaprenylcistransferase [Hymenopellis radicata]|nr:Di-trans-poly-cis-decaprenylcistransferase [Hymenopellis radicata]
MFGVLSFLFLCFSWLQAKLLLRAQRLLLRVLAAGPVPRHVAFVMDGNRRYARMNHKQVSQGHADGYLALRRILEICLRLNITCVSVYAFAIENFKRSPDEVAALLDLCQEKLLELCEHGDLLHEYGVRLNVIGRVERFPLDVQVAIDKARNLTKDNKRSILNVCMPYASTDEITCSVETCVQSALETNNLSISEKDIENNLMTTLAGSPPLDIIVRTSGSSENVQVQFSSTYWPDFGLFDFIPIILDYQRKVWSL